jgi:hypothetical protein
MRELLLLSDVAVMQLFVVLVSAAPPTLLIGPALGFLRSGRFV